MNKFPFAFDKSILILVITIIFLAFNGCASSSTPTPTLSSIPTQTAIPTSTTTPSLSPSTTPAPSPTVSPTLTPIPTSTIIQPEVFILTPLYNVSIPPGDITVSIKVANFNLIDKIGQPNVSGEGHVIYYLDVTPPFTAGIRATTSPGSFYESSSTSYIWKNISEGTHTFSVQLVNNDGTPFVPPIFATESVPVAYPTPSVSSTITPSSTAIP